MTAYLPDWYQVPATITSGEKGGIVIRSVWPSLREKTDKVATKKSERTVNCTAEGAVARMIFGEEEIGADVAVIHENNGNLYLLCVWGLGEIEGLQSYQINGEDPPAAVTAVHYNGTATQGVDATLAAALAGYADNLRATIGGEDVSLAYSVLTIPANSVKGYPRVTAKVRGFKLYDPRTTLTAWSDNPSLALAHLIENYTDLSVDWDTVETCADLNDAEIGISGVKRRTLNLVLQRRGSIHRWVDMFAQYAAVYLSYGPNGVRFIPNASRGIDFEIGVDDYVAGSLKLAKRGILDTPNVIRVEFTDRSGDEWRDSYAIAIDSAVANGTAPWRQATIKLEGLSHYRQAYAEAWSLHDYYEYCDLYGSFVMFDEGIRIERGMCLSLTTQTGLSSKKVRVIEVRTASPGRFEVLFEEYSESVYTDAEDDGTDFGDTNLPGVYDLPDVTGLTLTEEVYQMQNGTYASRIKATWTPGSYLFDFYYRVEVRDASDKLIWEGSPATAEFRTGAIQEGVTYTVKVAMVSPLGGIGDYVSDTIQAQGKALVPVWPGGAALSGVEIGGTVKLSWPAAVDVDIRHYDVRYGATGGAYATATQIDKIDALRLETVDIPEGTWRFYVDAVDSIGQYTGSPLYTDIVVTTDRDAFEQHQEFDNPALTNVIAFQKHPRLNPEEVYYVSNDSQDAATRFGATVMATLTENILTYQEVAGQIYLSETWDIGYPIAGNWLGEIFTAHEEGSPVEYLELSDNGSDWDQFSSPMSAKDEYRYARLRVTGGAGDVIVITPELPRVRIGSVPRTEYGDDTSLASGGKTITLNNEYVRAVAIRITPLGTAARSFTVDNVQVGVATCSFDVYIWNDSGAQVANDFKWEFFGI